MTTVTAQHTGWRLVTALLLVNTCGSFFVLLRLSTEVNDTTGSGLLAGAVLAAPWLPALIFAGPLNRLLARRPPDRLILAAEAASLMLTLGLAAVPMQGQLLLIVATSILLVRGFFEAVTRSATTVLLRITTPPNRLHRANTLAEIGKLAGTSCGAVLAGFADPALSLRGFLAVNAGTLAVSVVLARLLPHGVTQRQVDPSSRTTTGLRLDNPVLRRLFALFGLVAVWQGYHTIAVNVVPREVLGGDTSLVGVFVAMSAGAIFAGSFAALPVQRYLTRVPVITWALLPMPFLLAAVLVASRAGTLALYGIFLIFFEIAYVRYNNELLAIATLAEVPVVVTLRATALPLGVVVSTVGVGILSDLSGPVVATVAIVVVTVLVAALAWPRGGSSVSGSTAPSTPMVSGSASR